MWNLFSRYKGGKAVPSAKQLNLIADILNNITAGSGIALTTPSAPTPSAPVVVAIDTEWLKAFVGGGGVSSVDGVGPDQTGNVDLGAVTDSDLAELSNGVLSVANGALATTAPVAASKTVDVVTNVAWNTSTHVLSKTVVTLTFTKGILTAVSNPTTSTVDTATSVVWS